MNDTTSSPENALSLVLKYGGTRAAEQRMAELATIEGDAALIPVVAQLSGAEVCAIIKDADLTKPSLLFALSSSEQVAAVFRRLGLSWNEYFDEPPSGLFTSHENVRIFFATFVLSRDADGRKAVLEVLLEEPNIIEAMVFAIDHHKDFDSFVRSNGNDPSEEFEFLRVLREYFPEDFIDVLETAKSLLEDEVRYSFDRDFLNEAYQIAIVQLETGTEESTDQQAPPAEAEELFTPLS